MVEYSVNEELDLDGEEPDIFLAARTNNVGMLSECIESGQSLDLIEAHSSQRTPLHIAAIYRCQDFILAAAAYNFNPWIRDCDGRLAIDHAQAQGLQDAQKVLLDKMYPPSWQNDAPAAE